MARLIKRGKNAGVIVVTKQDAMEPIDIRDLCKQATQMRADEKAAFAELVEDLGSVRAANRFLRQS